jgi:hypothetical protein
MVNRKPLTKKKTSLNPQPQSSGVSDVMPDLISLPWQLVSRGHPVQISGFRLLSSFGGLAGMTTHRKRRGIEH